jgi:hypothetical protein
VNKEQPSPGSHDATTGRSRRIKLAVILALLAVVAYVGGNGMKNAWAMQRKLDCARNMRAVADAVRLYHESLPPGISAPPVAGELTETLIATGAIKAKQLLCPVARPHESNYVIASPTRVPDEGTAVPYVWEPLSNHDDEGANIHFYDGHTEFVKPDRFRELIREVDMKN